MLPDIGPVAVPPWEGNHFACIVIQGPSLCLVTNTRLQSCLTTDRVWFEWQPGTFHKVKMNDWSIVSSSHGTVTTQTNADAGILGVPTGTSVTAMLTRASDNLTYEVVFRMEDEYVVFEKVDPPGGW